MRVFYAMLEVFVLNSHQATYLVSLLLVFFQELRLKPTRLVFSTILIKLYHFLVDGVNLYLVL